jgi:hypothetical protein
MTRAPRDGSAHGQARLVASEDKIPDRRSCGADQNGAQPIKRQQERPPTASCQEQYRHDGRDVRLHADNEPAIDPLRANH